MQFFAILGILVTAGLVLGGFAYFSEKLLSRTKD